MGIVDGCFYHPTRAHYDAPEGHGLRYDSVFFAGADSVRLHGLFFPADGQTRGTVVHCHGNAGNVSGHFHFVAALPELGWNVFCFDYRGYGRSTGKVNRAATVADTHAAVDYVRSRPDVDPGRVVLFGQSLGGTVGLTAAAERNDLRGIAVEGAFAGYRWEAYEILRKTFLLRGVAGLAARYLVSDELSPIDVVDRIAPCPSLFICGTADAIVSYEQAVALYEAARNPKELWVVEGGEHCDALLREDGEGLVRLTRFFTFCV